MKVLYDYIVNPQETLAQYERYKVGVASGLVLIALAFTITRSFSLVGLSEQVFWVLLIGMAIFIQSVLIDTVAQLLGKPTQGLRSFHWMLLSYLPYLLLPPIQIVFGAHGLFLLGLSNFLQLLIKVGVVYLQVKTIQRLYCTKFWQGFLIYGAPFMGVLLIIAMIFGVAILFFTAPFLKWGLWF